MLEAYGYVPLGGHVRVGVAIFSYDGHVGFGVTGDYDSAPDIEVVCAGIEAAMAELVEISAPGKRTPANGVPAKRTRAKRTPAKRTPAKGARAHARAAAASR
jgi:hypothetical protein